MHSANISDVANLHPEVDTAIPCGLVINELDSNALKYAFPERDGALTITLLARPAGQYKLVIRDDGVGLPAALDVGHLDSLGLQLVKGLVEEQLERTLELCNTHGTT